MKPVDDPAAVAGTGPDLVGDGAQRRAGPDAPVRPQSARGWLLFGLAMLLAAAAGLGYWAYDRQLRPRQAAITAPAVPAGGQSGRIGPAAQGNQAAARGPGGPGGPGAPGIGPPATPVAAVAARIADIPIVLDALGTVVPAQSVTVRSRVAGQLVAVHFREGDLVAAGQLLAEIDDRELRVQLAQAEGQAARDRALLENARVDLKRYETLFRQDSIARQQVDTQAALVRQYEGLTRVNQSQVASARLQLSHARVTAPIAGRVGLRQIDAGNMVTGSEANGLVVITQVEPIAVVFTVPQDELPAIRRRLASGDTLPVIAFDRSQRNRLGSGRLESFDNQIDPATGTIKLKASFDNRDGALFPNQFVNVRLELDALRDRITIPSSAIQRGSQGLFVYVVRDNQTVALRTIETGPVDGQRIEVPKGLAAGELVVVDGVDRLRDGARVELVERPDFSAPPPPRPARQRGPRQGGQRSGGPGPGSPGPGSPGPGSPGPGGPGGPGAGR